MFLSILRGTLPAKKTKRVRQVGTNCWGDLESFVRLLPSKHLPHGFNPHTLEISKYPTLCQGAFLGGKPGASMVNTSFFFVEGRTQTLKTGPGSCDPWRTILKGQQGPQGSPPTPNTPLFLGYEVDPLLKRGCLRLGNPGSSKNQLKRAGYLE